MPMLSKFIVEKLVTESLRDNLSLRHSNVIENKMCLMLSKILLKKARK
jgi:hypothetical protein